MFSCNLCNKYFKFKSKLEEHKNNKKTCNSIKISTKCNLCNIEFPCLAKLVKHKLSKKHINIENQNMYNINNSSEFENENELLKKHIIILENNKKNDIEENELLKKYIIILENKIIKLQSN